MSLRIDAHHHLWRYTTEEFGWISDEMSAIRRDFLVEDLRSEMQAAHVDGAVAVQARQSIEETEWLLSLAHANSEIAGVVGWLPVAEENFPALLERFACNEKLRGLRHVVQAEPDGFLAAAAFNRGIERLREHSLVYDILIVERQLQEAIRFIDRHPAQPFVIDHIAKPLIAKGILDPWATLLREAAQRPNVSCKISGMVTEANPHRWSPAELKPYFDIALEAFGPTRLMIGTDWPVLTVGCGYAQWWQLVEDWIAPLSTGERDAVLGENAVRIYGLKLPAASS